MDFILKSYSGDFMKKFIFPFLIILAACHENDRDVAPVPTPPYQFNAEVAYQALSWATTTFHARYKPRYSPTGSPRRKTLCRPRFLFTKRRKKHVS